MPEESKKNQQKGKNEPKDQRRRRQGRQPAQPVEKKPEKQPERPIEKQSKEPEKPAFEPGPEFYKNLKRETDEILKITEEANTKYKKKEIQSNWAKYEMPVESYEDIDEQENMGADYEKLIQAPATAGGHFQFKHEKSWDTETGPSDYDKYFDINMDLLSLAVSTIPFYERNCIDQSMFTENDIVTMNHRATKFKHKYYNDKKYNTPELEAQEKILKNLASHDNNENPDMKKDESKDLCRIEDNNPTETKRFEDSKTYTDLGLVKKDQDFEKGGEIIENNPTIKHNMQINQVAEIKYKPNVDVSMASNNALVDDSEILFGDDKTKEANKQQDIVEVLATVQPHKETKMKEVKPTVGKQQTVVANTQKKTVIESPEDLEKWLDDFLDG